MEVVGLEVVSMKGVGLKVLGVGAAVGVEVKMACIGVDVYGGS